MSSRTAGRLPGLEARRNAVMSLLRSVESAERQSASIGEADGTTSADVLDRASSVQGRDAATMLAQVLSGNSEQIDRAMTLFIEGRYGTCEDCKRAIPSERLSVWPEATRCVDCQRRHELRPTA